MGNKCGECGRICNDFVITKRLKAKKDWVLKWYPEVAVCWSCLKTNHPIHYAEVEKRDDDERKMRQLKNKIICDCIQFRINGDRVLTEKDRDFMKSIIKEIE